MSLSVRFATLSDVSQLAKLRHALWPEGSIDEHAAEVVAMLEGRFGVMPSVHLVAIDTDGTLIGFVEAALRSVADGCDPARPVGYVEGWYVDEAHRRQGVGAALIRAGEDWARAQGCTEMASDSLLDNELAHAAHQALGFEIVDRVVQFRKSLA